MTKDNITSLDSGLVERLYNMVRPLWRYAKPGTPDAAMFDRSERGIMLRKSVEAIAAVQASDRTAQGREMVLEEALEPFARVARIQGPLSKDWPDDKPNIEFIPSAWPDWADFKRASEALKDQSNDRT